MSVMTVAASDFRANMLKYVDLAMEQGSSIVVMRHSRPWFEVNPVGSAADIGDLVPANREADVVTARTIKNEKLAEAIERDKVLIYER